MSQERGLLLEREQERGGGVGPEEDALATRCSQAHELL